MFLDGKKHVKYSPVRIPYQQRIAQPIPEYAPDGRKSEVFIKPWCAAGELFWKMAFGTLYLVEELVATHP